MTVPARTAVVVVGVVVAVWVAGIVVAAGGNGLRVEVRPQIVAGEPKVGVCVAEQCG